MKNKEVFILGYGFSKAIYSLMLILDEFVKEKGNKFIENKIKIKERQKSFYDNT